MGQVLTIEPNKVQQKIQQAVALHDQGELDDAYKIVEDLLAEDPDDSQALNLAASILKKANKTPIAISLAKRATDIRPDRPEPWGVLGLCQQHLWFLDKAMISYRKALKRATTTHQKALYKNDIGSVLLDQGNFAAAENWCRESIELEDDPLARHNLGLSLLAQRKWEEGWKFYSGSIGTVNRRNIKYRQPDEPTWDGTKGQTVIVYGEQGIGDEICFASMIPDMAKDCRVIFDCDKRLEGVFRRSFPDVKVYGTRNTPQLNWDEEDRTFDASISLAEIGKFYRKTDQDFPGTFYLKPCPVRVMQWKETFESIGKPSIGIAWSGGTWENGSKYRHAPLEHWKPLFDAIDAHWVCLEYKDSESQLKNTPVVQYPWATFTKDYDDTIALVAALDCVVSVPTAIWHAAGAVGTPVVAMKAQAGCWKTHAGIPFHPVMSFIDWQGGWSKSISAAIPEVKKCVMSA